MLFDCKSERCETPCWMRKVLLAAGVYHLLFAGWADLWPHLWFDWLGIERPNHPIIWQGLGLIIGLLGVGLIIASRNPIKHWMIVLIGFAKFSLGNIGSGVAIFQGSIALNSIWLMGIDDLIWWPPFAAILWACLRAHAGVPPMRSEPLSIAEAGDTYRLSHGKTLNEASNDQRLALVFLRHFGCTFTRQILRSLEDLHREAQAQGAELVLVHMLQNGKETQYLGESSGVTRIADPRCELYRAFGLGKGGFMELFGPRVWWPAALSIFKGCGVGHIAGDGLQMPGAFLFHHGKVIAAQPAHTSSDLPDLSQLFKTLRTAGIAPEA